VTFIFIAIHHARPEHRDEVLDSMREMAGILADEPGFIEAAPWLDADGLRVVGVSRWTSREAFEAAVTIPTGDAALAVPPRESRPRERLLLEEPPALPTPHRCA
jgi:quinol monooxygenase YgiN